MVVLPKVVSTSNPFVEVVPAASDWKRSKPSPVLLLVKVKEVGVAKPEDRVKAMFLPVVVVMVLPLLYADCRLCEAELQVMTSFAPFIHSAVPLLEVSPSSMKFEVPEEVKVILSLDVGVKETAPVVVKVLLLPTVRALLTVVVPVVAPIPTVVAAPPMPRVVALELKS